MLIFLFHKTHAFFHYWTNLTQKLKKSANEKSLKELYFEKVKLEWFKASSKLFFKDLRRQKKEKRKRSKNFNFHSIKLRKNWRKSFSLNQLNFFQQEIFMKKYQQKVSENALLRVSKVLSSNLFSEMSVFENCSFLLGRLQNIHLLHFKFSQFWMWWI